MKKEKVIVVILVILIIIGLFIGYFIKKDDNITNNTISSSQDEENLADIVIIKNGEIQNEELIDNFVDNVKIQEFELKIKQDEKNISVKYNPPEEQNDDNSVDNTIVSVGDGSLESNKKLYGYYSLYVDGNLEGEYPTINHQIRRMIQNDKVILYFDAPTIDYVKIPEICTYNLSSSQYTKKVDLSYHQRKDLGINNIFNAGEYSVKTFGGDVTIIIEGDMVYSLEDALNNNVITPIDILAQAEMDYKYGICNEAQYRDGGSVEYQYYGDGSNQYTILKLNTLDGDKDLVIGMGGPILSNYNKNK